MPPTRKTGRKKVLGRKKQAPTDIRAEKTVQGMLEGKTMMKAGLDAGFSKSHVNSHLYSSPTGDWIKKQVERRMKAAMAKSAVHTDVITGSLVEMMLASPADILPENEILQRARENGVDHLIKKLTITPTKFGDKIDLELYSRLDAISQLRDNFGMKQEPRANTYEDTRRQEVEHEIDRIAEAEGCDRPAAAKMLRDALGDDSPLIPTVNKYVN